MNQSMYPLGSVGPHKKSPVCMLKPKNPAISLARIVKTLSSAFRAANDNVKPPAGGCQLLLYRSVPLWSGFMLIPHKFTASSFMRPVELMSPPVMISSGKYALALPGNPLGIVTFQS